MIMKPGTNTIGYVPGEFLRKHNDPYDEDCLGFLYGPENDDQAAVPVPARSSEPVVYVAIEDYQTEDARQMSFSKGTLLVVVEKCEDG